MHKKRSGILICSIPVLPALDRIERIRKLTVRVIYLPTCGVSHFPIREMLDF